MNSIKISVLIAAGAFSVIASSPLSAQQNRYAQQVDGFLSRGAEVLRSSGLEETHEREIGQLNEDATETIRYTLRAGVKYTFVGMCDEDCSDLDLELRDARSNLLDNDVEDDDNPVVEFTPSRAGTFLLNVKMFRCGSEPCYYGVAVFSNSREMSGTSAARQARNLY